MCIIISGRGKCLVLLPPECYVVTYSYLIPTSLIWFFLPLVFQWSYSLARVCFVIGMLMLQRFYTWTVSLRDWCNEYIISGSVAVFDIFSLFKNDILFVLDTDLRPIIMRSRIYHRNMDWWVVCARDHVSVIKVI